jgi:hypothetical protein
MQFTFLRNIEWFLFPVLFSFIPLIFDEIIVSKAALNQEDFRKATVKQRKTYSIAGVGEMVMGSNYPTSKSLPKDSSFFFRFVKDSLISSDITVGSLEGCLLNDGGTAKNCNDPRYCFFFRMPAAYTANLKDAGFDFINLANNHSLDFGLEGADSTRKYLKEADIGFAGLWPDKYAITKRKDKTFGFVAFSSCSGCYSTLDILSAKALVQELASQADIIIVFFDAGTEGSDSRHVTKEDEIFLGRNTGNEYELSHAVIDAGADVVFGVGTHVLRSVELYKDRFIAYSCGNFCVYGINSKGYCGISAIFKVNVLEDGTFESARIIPISVQLKGIPLFDIKKQAIGCLQGLLKTDFPQAEIDILDDGEIMRKPNH